MAHPDLAKVFGHRARRGRARAALRRRRPRPSRAAGVAVEVSTAGLRKPVGELYPAADRSCAACRRAGVPATLASDAHRPEDVGRDFDRAVAALREAGYRTLARFRAPRAQRGAPWLSRRAASASPTTPTAWCPGRPLVLGGVTSRPSVGLDGHSDADIVCHALIDATLGALALGDIGRCVPGHRRVAAARRSLDLLRRTYDRVARPRLAAGQRRLHGRAGRARASPRTSTRCGPRWPPRCGAEPAQVSVRGTTGDGLGFAGRGEGAAAHAVVLLRRDCYAGTGASPQSEAACGVERWKPPICSRRRMRSSSGGWVSNRPPIDERRPAWSRSGDSM